MIEDLEVDQGSRRLGPRTGLYVPMIVRDRPIGVITAHDKEGIDARFSDEDVRLAETFAARAAVAVDLSERVASDALRRVVSAQELERERLARELRRDRTGADVDFARPEERRGRKECLRGLGSDRRVAGRES